MTAQDNARKAIPLLAECAVCSEHASEDSQAHPLDELRMSPDNEPYCLNCWDQLPREDVGPWSEAETLEHYLSTPSPPSSAGEREGERGEAIALANRMLDRINADPDDDLAVLSRQLLRAVEFRAEISRALRSVTTTPDTGREG